MSKKVRLSGGELVRNFATVDRGGHGVVTGTCRLPVADEAERFGRDEAPALTRSRSGAYADAVLVARLIKTWDVEGPDGRPAPVTADNVIALPVAVRDQFMDIVLGFVADPTSGGSPAT